MPSPAREMDIPNSELKRRIFLPSLSTSRVDPTTAATWTEAMMIAAMLGSMLLPDAWKISTVKKITALIPPEIYTYNLESTTTMDIF